MQQPATRFELLLPRPWRRELDKLAAESGLSVSDLTRLAVRFLLDHKGRLVKIVNDKKGAAK